MRIAIALTSLLLLTACADGRWVANDLSSYSFKFSAPSPAGPFSKSRASAPPQAALAAPARAPRRTLAASSY